MPSTIHQKSLILGEPDFEEERHITIRWKSRWIDEDRCSKARGASNCLINCFSFTCLVSLFLFILRKGLADPLPETIDVQLVSSKSIGHVKDVF